LSFLTPLYLLGALAIAAPIVFHLIRRTPRGEVAFSSLMFLATTPPRMTRRSRLDNWPLLLLRVAALVLLAMAFARPFLRRAVGLDPGDGGRRRVLVLVDTSASMRRADLWPRAKDLAREAIAGCRPGDQLAVFAFDATTRPLLGFAESATLDPAKRQAVAAALLDGLAPTWAATDLGRALVDAVGAVEDVADASEKAGRIPRRVVLISDLQQGARVEALGGFVWPSDVELDPKPVAAAGPNAGLRRLADPVEGAATAEAARPLRVRVENDPGSRRESFQLAWLDAKGAEVGRPVDVYVPPGEGRVVAVARPAGSTAPRALRLRGDAHPFDNTIAIAAGTKEEVAVLFLGPDPADDPNGLLYYLRRVFEDSPGRSIRVDARAATEMPPSEPGPAPALIVVAAEPSPEVVARLRSALIEGSTVLLPLLAAGPGPAATVATLAGVPAPAIAEAPAGRDVMLGEVSFDHPIFAPLAGAQFSDFTKIRFWKHRRLDPKALGDARVLARFEDGDPAVIEKPAGKGRLVILTSGWAPADSQLARSSKFVPLMAALLEGKSPRPPDAASSLVGEPLPLPEAGPGRDRVVRKPDATTATPPSTATTFAGTDQPGVYDVEGGDRARSFAVDLDPAESRTTPLTDEALEQLGCRLASRSATRAVDRDATRQMQNGELEGRQKLWRWLILAAIGVLIVETLLAGRLSRARPARAEALAT